MRSDFGGSTRLTVKVRSCLPAALHHVAGLHEDRLLAEILDGQRVDIAGFADAHDALGQRLLQRERHWAGLRCSVHEIDREIVVADRTGEMHRFGIWRGAGDASGQKQDGKRIPSKHG
jgi:hypothetical protein